MEPARIIDLSRHGTRLEVRSGLAPASVCRLSLPTAEGEISVRATVRRCRAAQPPDGAGLVFDAGLEFDSLQPHQVELIEDSIIDLVMTERS